MTTPNAGRVMQDPGWRVSAHAPLARHDPEVGHSRVHPYQSHYEKPYFAGFTHTDPPQNVRRLAHQDDPPNVTPEPGLW